MAPRRRQALTRARTPVERPRADPIAPDSGRIAGLAPADGRAATRRGSTFPCRNILTRRPIHGIWLWRTDPRTDGHAKRYAELGVRHMMVNLQGDTLAQTLERMRRFADRIMPLTR